MDLLRRKIRAASALLVVFGCLVSSRASAQEERPEVMKALDLESEGKLKEAAVLFRQVLRSGGNTNAILGLERVYAELHLTDSLIAPLDTLIAANPRDPIYRTVQLRTFQILRRDDALRSAFENWVRASPRDASPYREYARILIGLGRPSTADSIVVRGRRALGSLRDLEFENAQLRAAMGDWIASAQSWRRALVEAPHYAGAAAFALTPVPAALRDSVRAALAMLPADPGSRSALASLEMNWGHAPEAWDALLALRADTTAASIWEEFGDRAFTEERWSIARDALTSALHVHATPALAIRAAQAAVKAGAPNDVFTLAPLKSPGLDSQFIARQYVPVHVDALTALGRTPEAEALVARFDHFFFPAQRMRLAQTIATAWVRTGDIARARVALRSAGSDADSSDAAGWLALYEGRLAVARTLLRTTTAPSADLSLALGVMARTRVESAPLLGAAFLALARGDSADASRKFLAAAVENPDAAPALLSQAARLQGTRSATVSTIWQQLIAAYPGSPEAVEAELDWARALRRSGQVADAQTHLEHLILSAPQSALLPQARRELEQLRGTVPPS